MRNGHRNLHKQREVGLSRFQQVQINCLRCAIKSMSHFHLPRSHSYVFHCVCETAATCHHQLQIVNHGDIDGRCQQDRLYSQVSA
jgi:hypothetical protein